MESNSKFHGDKISANVLADLLEQFSFLSNDFRQIQETLYNGTKPHEFHERWDPADKPVEAINETFTSHLGSLLDVLASLGSIAVETAQIIRYAGNT